jgi:hypothetical protein
VAPPEAPPRGSFAAAGPPDSSLRHMAPLGVRVPSPACSQRLASLRTKSKHAGRLCCVARAVGASCGSKSRTVSHAPRTAFDDTDDDTVADTETQDLRRVRVFAFGVVFSSTPCSAARASAVFRWTLCPLARRRGSVRGTGGAGDACR